MVLIYDPSSSFILLMNKFLVSFLISSQNIVSSVAGFHLVFSTSLSFRLIISFVTGVLHEGSFMMVHQGFIFLLEVFIVIIFRGDQVFFILHSKVQFFLPYHFRWFYVILDNLSSCFMIHMLLRMRYFKSINLFVGVILGLFFT